MKVEIYSDVACPWCYIGEQRFFRALAVFPQSDQIDVVFRPFQLDPSLPEEPVPLNDRLREKFGERLEATLRYTTSTAKKEGLDLRFDDALAVNTLTAHRLLRLALLEYGPETQRVLAEKLFEAHFTNGENIADPALLTALAVSAGMARDRVETYLASERGLRQVQDEIEKAQRLGIRAVPTFVFDGRFAVQGAQRTSTFLQALEEMYREVTETELEEQPTDACVDGACNT